MQLRNSGFKSFFLGGFECSTHKLRCGKRLDIIASTKHDEFVDKDYERLKSVGIETARDAIRWHLIERSPRRYDFRSAVNMLSGARRNRIQVIWDLCHYGWPDDIDIFKPNFVNRFAAFARECARVVASETDAVPYFATVNEISFFAWGAGDVGCLNPFETGRGNELKAQLVRACIAAIEAIRDVHAGARFVQVDPLINVIADPMLGLQEIEKAEAHNRAVYTAWDMIAGREHPELGGHEHYLDIVGANYYVHNQWVRSGTFIERTNPQYKPLHVFLSELYRRYERPIFIAETGIEDQRRPEWLAYICDEVVTALKSGTPVDGVCLYPIVNHPGWDDERHCHNGLWDYCNDWGERDVYKPLAEELALQQTRISQVLASLERDSTSLSALV